MTPFIFVSLRDDDLIARFDISRGVPENRFDIKLQGGPAPMVMNRGKTRIFIATRHSNELVCMRVNEDAGLSPASRVSLPSNPCFLGMDNEGRYVFSAYYEAGQITIHRWDEKNDSLTETQRINTEPNAHSAWLPPGDRYVYIPHTGPNKIYLYEFESVSGTLKPLTPPWFTPESYLEPRHLCFHPSLDCFYVMNEASSTVSVYGYNRKNGAVQCRQTVSAIPAGETSVTGAEIRILPGGRYLYASNRGHDSIACFEVDGTGSIELKSNTPSPHWPRAFDISPDACFLYAAGEKSGELAAYEIDQNSGGLKELKRMFIGNCPLWILPAVL